MCHVRCIPAHKNAGRVKSGSSEVVRSRRRNYEKGRVKIGFEWETGNIRNSLCSSVVTVRLVSGPAPTEVEAESVML